VRHTRGILDTSAVLALPVLGTPELLSDVPLITTITLAELSVGLLVATDEQERGRRQRVLQQVEADFSPLPFDAAAARAFASVAAGLRRAGRKPAARAYDAMIAAVAVSQALPVYTANPVDFAAVPGLDTVTVPAG
jgi:tRNA(fMet)-specific endonuclease VapC